MMIHSRLPDVVILMKLVFLIIFLADYYIQAIYKLFSLPTIQCKPTCGVRLEKVIIQCCLLLLCIYSPLYPG